jgi:glycine/D-amino acid oxidase-like deaminating enzyme
MSQAALPIPPGNISCWMHESTRPDFGPLETDAVADVCIVGAGIAGMTTAYLLGQAGKSVIVLDDGPIGGGMTQFTTAHLSNAIDDRYFEMERLHGERGAQLAAESHTAAIHRIEMIVQKEAIDCEFRRLDGYLFLSPSEQEEHLDRELAAAHLAGLSDVQKSVKRPLASLSDGPCLRFPNQAQFHPLKYLAGPAAAILRDGGRICTGSHVDKINGGSPARIEVGRFGFQAEYVVVATNTPVNDLVAIHTKQAPYMSYVIGAAVPAGSVPHALY